MSHSIDRRNFLKLAGIGGVVFASGLGFDTFAANRLKNKAAVLDDFYFVQLSDTHWGFNGPAINPDAALILPKAIAAVNSLEHQFLYRIYRRFDAYDR